MPRNKLPYETSKILITIPTKLETLMRDSLFDSGKGRVPGGAVSQYIESLIKRDLSKNESLSLEDLIGEQSNE